MYILSTIDNYWKRGQVQGHWYLQRLDVEEIIWINGIASCYKWYMFILSGSNIVREVGWICIDLKYVLTFSVYT